MFSELKAIQQKEFLFVHRFVDSHDAGRFVAPQPADFLLATRKSGTVYLEAKSSEVYLSLADAPRDMFSSQQIGKMTLLARAGQPVYCIFYSSVADKIELWNLNGAINAIVNSNYLDEKFRLKEGTLEFTTRILKDTFL